MMSNHIHLIMQSDTSKLSDTIRDLKSYSTKKFLAAIKAEPESSREWLMYMFRFYANNTNRNDEFKIWIGDNHPEQITSKDFLFSKLNYIHENPVRSGTVAKPEDYLYSSASSYVSNNGFLKSIFCFELLF